MAALRHIYIYIYMWMGDVGTIRVVYGSFRKIGDPNIVP